MVWLFWGLGIYVFVLLAICYISARPPRIPLFFAPGTAGLPQEDVEFQSNDGIRLRGWWTAAPDSKAVAVFVHGYLMNRSELAPLSVWLFQRGVSSLAFDLRAHGKSGGRKCTFGRDEARDVLVAVETVKKLAPNKPVLLIGSSMGAAASALAIETDPGLCDVLVLDCAYSRLWVASLGWWRFMGGRVLQVLLAPTVVLGPLVTGVNPFGVDVAKALRTQHKAKVFIVHGSADTLAPPSEALRNQAACKGSELHWMEGCGHAEGRWVRPEEYLCILESALSELNLRASEKEPASR